MSDKSAMPPASEPFPGSRTPGWNDPPPLQFNPQTTAAVIGRPRHSLNKRVAFPLQGIERAETTNTKPIAIVPPNQQCMPPTSIPYVTTAASQPIAVVHPMLSNGNLPMDAQQLSMQWLQAQLSEVKESLNVRREDVQMRLNIMAELWRNGSLSAVAQEKIYHFSKAISHRLYREAMELYTYLTTNHARECTQWGFALRHIALTIEPTNDTENINSAPLPTMFVPPLIEQTQPAQPENTNTYSSVQQL